MMKKPEVQQNWGWFVVLYIFLAGLGGGIFFFSFLLINTLNEPAEIGVYLGPVLVLIGTFMLLFDLGSPVRAIRLFTARNTLLTSWMSRGAWILTAFIILGLAYALPAVSFFEWLPWNQAGWGRVSGFVAAILSIVVMLYPGLLLGVIKSIPLWNTSALPLLFLASGLDTGMAGVVLLSLASPLIFDASALHLLAVIDIVLIFMVLVVLGAYLEMVRQTGETAAVSMRLLLTPLFIWGVVVAGLLVPLAVLAFSIGVSDIQTIRVLETITGILILGGGLLLRYGVVKSGVRLPVI